MRYTSAWSRAVGATQGGARTSGEARNDGRNRGSDGPLGQQRTRAPIVRAREAEQRESSVIQQGKCEAATVRTTCAASKKLREASWRLCPTRAEDRRELRVVHELVRSTQGRATAPRLGGARCDDSQRGGGALVSKRDVPKVVASVTTHATIEMRKSRVRSEQYDHDGDYQSHVDTSRGVVVVQVQLACGQWKVATVNVAELVGDVVKAVQATAEEVRCERK